MNIPILNNDIPIIKSDIQLYVSGLRPQQPTNTGNPYIYIWPEINNPIPETDLDNYSLRVSGFIEDYSQLLSKLGPDGDLWKIDYETHLEQGTIAVLIPIVKLAERINERFNLISNEFNLISDKLVTLENGFICEISKIRNDSDISISYPRNWPDVFRHFPRLQFYKRITVGNTDTYELNDTFIQYFSIQEIQNNDGFVYTVRPRVLNPFEQGTEFVGRLIVW